MSDIDAVDIENNEDEKTCPPESDTITTEEAVEHMENFARGTQKFMHSTIIKIGAVVVSVKIVDVVGKIMLARIRKG